MVTDFSGHAVSVVLQESIKEPSYTAWPLTVGQIGCPETSVTITDPRCVT
jgi:hypothetical protein